MKIQGTQPALNTYKKIQQQKFEKKEQPKDQLDISKAAKSMQQSKISETKRAEYVNDIKALVDAGEYKVDHEQLANKMIQFWSKEI